MREQMKSLTQAGWSQALNRCIAREDEGAIEELLQSGDMGVRAQQGLEDAACLAGSKGRWDLLPILQKKGTVYSGSSFERLGSLAVSQKNLQALKDLRSQGMESGPYAKAFFFAVKTKDWPTVRAILNEHIAAGARVGKCEFLRHLEAPQRLQLLSMLLEAEWNEMVEIVVSQAFGMQG